MENFQNISCNGDDFEKIRILILYVKITTITVTIGSKEGNRTWLVIIGRHFFGDTSCYFSFVSSKFGRFVCLVRFSNCVLSSEKKNLKYFYVDFPSNLVIEISDFCFATSEAFLAAFKLFSIFSLVLPARIIIFRFLVVIK